MRIGFGYDAHRFADAENRRPLFIAGLEWEGNGIDGDSDGDVAIHALIDALLSAAQLGDIGMLFGVGSASRGAGMRGTVMLEETVRYVRKHGYAPGNATVTVIGNRPKIGPRRGEAQRVLSEIMGCPISLTATTTDGMGFTGRGEGIAAMANVLLESVE